MTPELDALVNTFKEAYGAEPAYVTMAPGRLEFLGNHTDYNGGRVLGVALNLGVYAGISERDDSVVRIATRFQDGGLQIVQSDVQSIALAPSADPRSWANYPLGVLKVILERAEDLGIGFDLALNSDLPIGAGLSSSAAVELASLRAISILYDLDIDDPLEIARLGRKAENDCVGVPCGLFDQVVSAAGKKGEVVLLDCATEQMAHFSLPQQTRFWIFDTRIDHRNAEGKYAERHEECRRALASLEKTYSGIESLCDLAPGQVEPCEQDMGVDEFKRALHVTRENERVKQAVSMLVSDKAEPLGQLLFESHESSKELFENSTVELDFLVDSLKKEPSVLGARLSGCGFGGAVVAWTRDDFTQEHADGIRDAYASKFGKTPAVIAVESGDGARIL